jgi:hypothetical protein
LTKTDRIMKAQITLTVAEAKRIIAKGIARLPAVQATLESGKIFLKGGTTVSALAGELVGRPLRISGRITPQGAKASQKVTQGFHSALIQGGKLIDVDARLEEAVESLGADDVAVFGANAIDVYGNAALMYGAPLGGRPGRIVSGIMAELSNIIIAVGLEKLIPGCLTDIVSRTGNKAVDIAMGMPAGLTPIIGRIITEKDALMILADVECTVIGMGGISGAEGSTTMVIEGRRDEVERAFAIATSVKGMDVSGEEESLPACEPPNERCKLHRACIYKPDPSTQ